MNIFKFYTTLVDDLTRETLVDQQIDQMQDEIDKHIQSGHENLVEVTMNAFTHKASKLDPKCDFENQKISKLQKLCIEYLK